MKKQWFALALVALMAAPAAAQEVAGGAGRYELGGFPGGGLFFTGSSGDVEPGFGAYTYGASFTIHMNRWIAFEPEAGFGIGVRQTVAFGHQTLHNQPTPDSLVFTGNLLYSPLGTDRVVAPYIAGGVGAMTLLSRDQVENLGVTSNETFLTGNVGGGVKWYATREWGARADYRLVMVGQSDTAPTFFGQQGTRYGHRFYAGLFATF